MDIYNKEGDRNQDFNENDKGTWTIGSFIRKRIDEYLYSEGLVLRFNKNTTQATGHYYIRTTSQKHGDTEIKYPVYYDETGIHLVEDIEDEELKNKILNFKFLIEYVSFEDGYIQSLPLLDKRFNANVPLYNVTYRLTNEDENIQTIKQQYAVTQKFQEQPRLRIEGKGRAEWGPLSNRRIMFLFDENSSISIKESIFFG